VRTRRYVQKFYQMRTQLQAVGLRIQTLRSNQQMADAMRGATRVRHFFCYLLPYPTPSNPPSFPRACVSFSRASPDSYPTPMRMMIGM
jgi:hypothetical protein